MTCGEANVFIEAIAAGDGVPQPIRAHAAECPACAARVRLAQQIDRWLTTRPSTDPPPQFTGGVMMRIRRERWRAEQTLDWAFNIAVAMGVLLVISGLVGLVWASGVADISRDVFGILDLVTQSALRRAADEARTFGMAAVMLTLSVTIWWWVERDATA